MVLDGISISEPGQWSVVAKGILYRQPGPDGKLTLRFWGHQQRASRVLARLEGIRGQFGNLTTSADGRQVLFDRLDDWHNELYLSVLQLASR